MTIKKLKDKIDSLKSNNTLKVTHSILLTNYFDLMCVEYTRMEAFSLVFLHDNALDSGEVEEDTELWSDIRDLQLSLIDFFCIEEI